MNVGRDFGYRMDSQTPEEEDEQKSLDRPKVYRRDQALRARRRMRKAASGHPGYGISGRRNRRWTW